MSTELTSWIRRGYADLQRSGRANSTREFAAYLGVKLGMVTGWLAGHHPTKPTGVVALRERLFPDDEELRTQFCAALLGSGRRERRRKVHRMDPLIAIRSGEPLEVQIVHAPPFASGEKARKCLLDEAFARFAGFANLRIRLTSVDFESAIAKIASGSQEHMVVGLLCTLNRMLQNIFCTSPVRLGTNYVISANHTPGERGRLRNALSVDCKDPPFRRRIRILLTKDEIGGLLVERLLGLRGDRLQYVRHNDIDGVAALVEKSTAHDPIVRVADEFHCAQLINSRMQERGALLFDPVTDRQHTPSYYLGFVMPRTQSAAFADFVQRAFELYLATDVAFMAAHYAKFAG